MAKTSVCLGGNNLHFFFFDVNFVCFEAYWLRGARCLGTSRPRDGMHSGRCVWHIAGRSAVLCRWLSKRDHTSK